MKTGFGDKDLNAQLRNRFKLVDTYRKLFQATAVWPLTQMFIWL